MPSPQTISLQVASGVYLPPPCTGPAPSAEVPPWRDASRACILSMALFSPLGEFRTQAPPAVQCLGQSGRPIRISDTFQPSLGGQPPMPPMSAPIGTQASEPFTEELFQAIVSEWTLGIGPTSSSMEMVAHPAFRRLIARGKEAIPFLLREVKREPSLLVLALHEITGENPVPRESRGKIKEMAKAWVAWGAKNGLLR